jgi:hypothetical protein
MCKKRWEKAPLAFSTFEKNSTAWTCGVPIPPTRGRHDDHHPRECVKANGRRISCRQNRPMDHRLAKKAESFPLDRRRELLETEAWLRAETKEIQGNSARATVTYPLDY